METRKINITKGLHAGDIFYRARPFDIISAECRVIEEPQAELTEDGRTVWTVKYEHLADHHYFRNTDGQLEFLKTTPPASKEYAFYGDDGGLVDVPLTRYKEVFVNDAIVTWGFKNDPYACAPDEKIRIEWQLFETKKVMSIDVSWLSQRTLNPYGKTEVVDVIPDSSETSLSSIVVKSLLYAAFSALMLYWFPSVAMIATLIILLIILITADTSLRKWFEKPDLHKTETGNLFKTVLEHDFGDDFRALQAGTNGAEEKIVILPDESFERLKAYLDSIPDGDFGDRGKVTHKSETDDNIGFKLRIERLEGGCGNTEEIIANYKYKTLEYHFCVY